MSAISLPPPPPPPPQADVEGFEQDAILGGAGVWIPGPANKFLAEPPRTIIGECNHRMALQRGQNTWFWKAMAWRFGCRLSRGVGGQRPAWWERLPFADYIVLATCGGGSVSLTC